MKKVLYGIIIFSLVHTEVCKLVEGSVKLSLVVKKSLKCMITELSPWLVVNMSA